MSQLAQIADALAGGAVLLTPHLRAARHWRSRVEGLWASQAGAAWPTILPWRGWTAALYQRALVAGMEDRVLLNPVQTAALWEEVLREEALRLAGRATLRPVRSLVTLCEQAHALLYRYGGVARLLKLPEAAARELHGDARQFRSWLREMEGRCAAERLLPAPALEQALAGILQAGHVIVGDGGLNPSSAGGFSLAARYLLIGFDRFTPAQEDLLQAAEEAGVSIEHLAAISESAVDELAAPKLLAAPDGRGEYVALTRWLRELLKADPPDRQIAVVVPDLEMSRPALERTLREVVAPELQDVTTRAAVPWEFSTGVPLSSLPMVAHALLLLGWTQRALPAAQVSELLRSPFLALGLSLEEAGTLDAAVLRDNRRLRPEWTLSALIRSCGDRFPAWIETLTPWYRRYHDALGGQKTYAAWAGITREVLRDAGWPGTRERSSEEFQSVDRWNDLLDQVSSRDLFGQLVGFEGFLSETERWAADITFAPENIGASVQLMTPAEAAGITADQMWCAHADEARWSGRRAPHPLLPWSLQADLRMPGVDPGRDLAEAQTELHRLRQSAGDVVFSYAKANADGEVRPSTLVQALPGLIEQDATGAVEARPTVELEEFDDTATLPALPAGVLRGGVGVLQSQAACAFRAFAERRLFSTALEIVDLGMDARQRGNLLHAVLEGFWGEVRTHARLLDLEGKGELRPTVLRHIDAQLRTGTQDHWALAYLQVQRTRLCALLMNWLRHEGERKPFEVLDIERELKGVKIGPLRVDLRVDRIDRVDVKGEKALVLIDYKTGSADAKSWLGDRPEEPQLPLYAVAAGLGEVRAIAFGRVKAGSKHLGLRSFPQRSEMLFSGKSQDDPEHFAEQMESWSGVLERLATEFHAGDATVGPREYPTTCTYCEQRMLCRLNPEQLEVLAEEDTAEFME